MRGRHAAQPLTNRRRGSSTKDDWHDAGREERDDLLRFGWPYICPTTMSTWRRSIERRNESRDHFPTRRMAHEQKEAYSWGARYSLTFILFFLPTILTGKTWASYVSSFISAFI